MNIDTIQKISHLNQNNKKLVEIIAVTKTHPFETVLDAYNQGFRHMGENRLEEAIQKIYLARQDKLSDIIWHMIGHVQSRKVKDVVTNFDRVDSVDSIGLLEKLNTEAKNQSKLLRVLLEVNISGEDAKYGIHDLHASMLQDIYVKNLQINGLMTMAPYVHNPEQNRWIFQRMKELSLQLQAVIPGFGCTLSMGTSCDYQVAIEEGATEIRLGQTLFGSRPR